MNPTNDHDVTELLLAWSRGEQQALDRLIPLVYDQLRGIAARELSDERRTHTLQPTALVNEAFCKLIQQDRVQWQNRQQFFGVAAETMQRILINHARKHFAAKRGGRLQKIPLADLELPDQPVIEMSEEKLAELLTLDDALQALQRLDPLKSRIVALRYVMGFSAEETAEALNLSPASVGRHWRAARAFLKQELTRAASNEVTSIMSEQPIGNSPPGHSGRAD